MKIKGKKIQGPNIEIVVLPRQDGDLVFKAQAVLDYDDFNKLYPEPLPPMITRRGETQASANVEDSTYKEAVRKRAEAQFSWMILKSLQATEDLQWELIDMANPQTWTKLDDEFKASGITNAEKNRIIQTIFNANGLNEEKLEEARKRFLASQQALPKV